MVFNYRGKSRRRTVAGHIPLGCALFRGWCYVDRFVDSTAWLERGRSAVRLLSWVPRLSVCLRKGSVPRFKATGARPTYLDRTPRRLLVDAAERCGQLSNLLLSLAIGFTVTSWLIDALVPESGGIPGAPATHSLHSGFGFSASEVPIRLA